MNELLKAKYYKIINSNDFSQYENVGKILAIIENKLIQSDYTIPPEKLIELLSPLIEFEQDVYQEIIKDINSGLIYGGGNNE